MLKKIKFKIRRIHEYIFGHKNYVKFVVITRSRTGSNLLISLLNSNPNIRAYGEKFNRLKKKNCNLIYKEIFPMKSYKAIGFKIFYQHPIDSEDKTIWDLIKRNKNIKIVHLQRKNILRIHISRLIAGKTKRWSSIKEGEIEVDTKKIFIDFEKLIDDVNNTKNWVNNLNNEFENNRIINIYYEDLVKNKNETIKDICKFLGVPHYKSSSKLKKQNPEKIEDLIINYNEIKEKLENTQFSQYDK